MGWEPRGQRLREIEVVACYPTHQEPTAGIPPRLNSIAKSRETVLPLTGFSWSWPPSEKPTVSALSPY